MRGLGCVEGRGASRVSGLWGEGVTLGRRVRGIGVSGPGI